MGRNTMERKRKYSLKEKRKKKHENKRQNLREFS
jgi:hypothetical protein